MLTLTPASVAICILVPLVGFLAAKWLFQKDTEIEDRRRGAIRLCAVLKSYGLVEVPKFLESYAVGDYSGVAHQIKQLAELFLSGEDAVVKEFNRVYERVLDAKLRTEEGRALIAAKLGDAVKDTDPSAVTSAPTAQVVKS